MTTHPRIGHPTVTASGSTCHHMSSLYTSPQELSAYGNSLRHTIKDFTEHNPKESIACAFSTARLGNRVGDEIIAVGFVVVAMHPETRATILLAGRLWHTLSDSRCREFAEHASTGSVPSFAQPSVWKDFWVSQQPLLRELWSYGPQTESPSTDFIEHWRLTRDILSSLSIKPVLVYSSVSADVAAINYQHALKRKRVRVVKDGDDTLGIGYAADGTPCEEDLIHLPSLIAGMRVCLGDSCSGRKYTLDNNPLHEAEALAFEYLNLVLRPK